MKMDCVCFVNVKRGSRMFVSVKLFIWTFHMQELKSPNSLFDELEVFLVFAPNILYFSVFSPISSGYVLWLWVVACLAQWISLCTLTHSSFKSLDYASALKTGEYIAYF